MRSNELRSWVLSGALAGLVGGVVFGAAMLELGVLDSIAAVVRAEDSFGLGVAVHFTIAATVGAGFGALVWHQRLGAGETVLWGVTYGALWWFVGPLTVRPILAGDPIWLGPALRASRVPTAARPPDVRREHRHRVARRTPRLARAPERRGADPRCARRHRAGIAGRTAGSTCMAAYQW